MQYKVSLIPLNDVKKAQGVLDEMAEQGFVLQFVISRDQMNAVVIAGRGQEPLAAAIQKRAKKADKQEDNG